MTLSKFGDGISADSSTVTMPASVQSGDIAVMCDNMRANSPGPTTVVPSGFTQFGSTLTVTNVATIAKRVLSYKILDGSEGGSTITGMSGNGAKSVIVFRSDVAGTWGAPSDVAEDLTNSDPSDQTINVGASPLVCLAWYESSAAVSPRSFSPSEDAEITVVSPTSYLKYKIYNSSPSNTTAGMDDEGFYNHLSSCYVAFSSASGEEEADGAAAGTGAASAVGGAYGSGVGYSNGSGAISAAGSGIFSGVGTSSGSSTLESLAGSSGTSTGAGTASGVSDANEAIGSSNGTGTAIATAESLGGVTEGVAAGTGVASSVGTTLSQSVGVAAGVGSAAGRSGSLGAATGTGAVTGNGTGIRPGAGAASGAGTAAGVSNYTQAVFGTAFSSGSGEAAGVAQYTAQSVGSSRAVSLLSGVVFGWANAEEATNDDIWNEREPTGDIWTRQDPPAADWTSRAA